MPHAAPLSPNQIADRLFQVRGIAMLADAARLTAEIAVAGTEQDADLCADVMNAVVGRLSNIPR